MFDDPLTALARRVSALQAEIKEMRRLQAPSFEWVTWTPVITQSGAVTKTITSARLLKAGKLRVAQALLAVTGAGTGNNVIVISGLPTGSQYSASRLGAVGVFRLNDASVSYYVGAAYATGADALSFLVHAGTDYVGKSPNFALANTDSLSFSVMYEID